ncbi:hypothetical protein [Radiobacillus deserti]|uniref:DUF4367 domain-containing protein n=1 Tax=Radiobacillus deserti TaxID=2594883 RepID=A0A516KDM5_9BACI|nr:hypothetical protein [Radiobacillus deserti]QDP39501.1 hypothetical protein FN924_04510 [Radiobacillus deserti]
MSEELQRWKTDLEQIAIPSELDAAIEQAMYKGKVEKTEKTFKKSRISKWKQWASIAVASVVLITGLVFSLSPETRAWGNEKLEQITHLWKIVATEDGYEVQKEERTYLSSELPTTKIGNVEEVEKEVGFPITLPSYVPSGSYLSEDKIQVIDGRMVYVSYRVDPLNNAFLADDERSWALYVEKNPNLEMIKKQYHVETIKIKNTEALVVTKPVLEGHVTDEDKPKITKTNKYIIINDEGVFYTIVGLKMDYQIKVAESILEEG